VEYKPEQWHAAHNVTCLLFHVQLTVKWRRNVITDMLIGLVESAIRQAGFRHGIDIYRVGTDINHAHVFMQQSPTLSLSRAVQYLKGISSRIIRLNMPCMKLILSDSFWSDGYWSATVGGSWDDVDRYIANQGLN